MKLSLISLLCGASLTNADPMYHFQKSSVSNLNKMNFGKQVTNNREKGISVVQFYNLDEAASKLSKGQYEKFSLEHKQMLRVGAVDCQDQRDLCKKEGIEGDLPRYRVYPPFPMPAQDLEGELDTDKLKKIAYKHIGSRVLEINGNNHDTFRTANVGTPKMLLFTEKKGTPIVYKALSTHFDKTLEFGIVRGEEKSLINKYKVTSFPSFYLLKNEDKPKKYTGESYTYQELFDFINIYSETFVFGGEEKTVESSVTKAWLNERIPFISKESGNDVCFMKDGTLCVIYVAANKDSFDQGILDAFDNLKEEFVATVKSGISFSFNKLDATAEPNLADAFNLEGKDAIVVMNPGKRKRYLVHEGEKTSASVQKTLQTILDGDARFKMIKGNKIPELVTAHEFYAATTN